MMAEQVVATEEWIRDKAQLSNVRSDEVETVSLHGSDHEKIVTLGDSLVNFKRLKSLDLSRNAIVSLEGLECLQELEKLSLYFNNIQTLEEISSLRHLIHLTELDLRLNPVTSTEENYRQYVICLLPNLLKLDLRPIHGTERNPAKFNFISQEQYETSEVDKSQRMENVFSYNTDEQNYVNRAQMCKWDGASNNQSDLRPVRGTERNPAKFDLISQEQYETSEVEKREDSQQIQKVFSYNTDEQNYVNRAQMCKWDGASNNQSELRSVPATEKNASKFDFISQEQYETSEVDKREESPQMKKVSYDTDQQNYVNRAQMCKWDGVFNNQSDVKTNTKYRSCRSIDEDDSTSIYRSKMLSTSQIPHNGTSSAHRLVDRQRLLSPSNSLTSFRTTCSKRSFTDRKETEHLRSEQNQIHPSEDLRAVHATERNHAKFDFISHEQYETSEVDKREESQQMKKVFSHDTDEQNYVNRAQMCKWDGASNNQSDVKTNTKYRSCRSIDEDGGASIHRSGMPSASQIPHNVTSSAHHLVDRQQLLSPSNSFTSLRTTCSKRSFTDRKEAEHLRSEQNQIHPSEDLRPVRANERNPVKFDFISHEQYETSEVDKREESHQMQKVFSYNTDEQNYVNQAQMCKWDGASNNQSDLRPVCATERNACKFDCILQEQYETSEVDKREESHQMKKVFSYDTDEQNYVNRAQMYKWGGASNNQSDVKTTTKYRSCRSIDEDVSSSIHRSRMLSTSQIPHIGASSAYRLVDRQQLLSPSNSLTSLRTTRSKRSFTDRKETEHLRSEQNQIHPSEDDHRNYQSPVRSSFCSVGKNVYNRSRERLRVTFADQVPVKNNKLSSRSIPKDDSARCLKLRMPSSSQMPHQETSSCDQQNRASASFTEHINMEIPNNKSSERRSKLTGARMEYIDKRLEATKTSSLNSLQPSYNGKTTHHKLPEIDQCGDYIPQIPYGLRSGSSANISQHLQNLLDLVDRYWSGSNSLHRNQRFLNSAEELLFNALDTMAISKIQSLEQKVKVLTEENGSLLTRTASGLDSAEFLRIKHELTQKEDDLESLNGKFEKLIEENNKLHSQLRSLELANSAGLQQRNKELHKENDRLNLQVKYLNQQIKQHNKLKDAITMLQESHRAIISSNNYLQELLNANSTGQRTDMSNVLSKGLGPKR